jgi:hypothetical protein
MDSTSKVLQIQQVAAATPEKRVYGAARGIPHPAHANPITTGFSPVLAARLWTLPFGPCGRQHLRVLPCGSRGKAPKGAADRLLRKLPMATGKLPKRTTESPGVCGAIGQPRVPGRQGPRIGSPWESGGACPDSATPSKGQGRLASALAKRLPQSAIKPITPPWPPPIAPRCPVSGRCPDNSQETALGYLPSSSQS